MSPRLPKSLLRDRVTAKLTLGDGLVDAGQLLVNDSARAEIEMAHFRVAHLPFGQSDIESARAQFPAGIIAIELIVEWGAREQGGVAVFFPLLPTAGINAPAVSNNENNGLRHGGAFSRRSSPQTSAFPRWRLTSRSAGS